MAPILHAQPLSKSNRSYVDGIEDDCRDLAARIVAVRFGLQPHIAELLCHLAGIGAVRR